MVALCQVAEDKYVDVASPIDSETRHMIEEKVFAAYQPFANEPVKRRLWGKLSSSSRSIPDNLTVENRLPTQADGRKI